VKNMVLNGLDDSLNRKLNPDGGNRFKRGIKPI
jgi:hypothetical protein